MEKSFYGIRKCENYQGRQCSDLTPMRNRFIGTALFFLLFFLGTGRILGFSSEIRDYLWLEFEKCVREKDGSVTLPLQINYGKFPKKIKDLSELDDVRAFYTLGEKDGKGNRIFYEAGIERDNGRFLTRIRAFRTKRAAILVEGRKIQSGTAWRYSAKASFVLIGHSSCQEKNEKPVAPDSEIERRFEICITPEFSYWPEVGNPVKITLLSGREVPPECGIFIFDEKRGLTEIKTTDKAGCHTYIPPEDKQLNWAGDTAFKQVVITAEEEEGNGGRISSYTLLLHRSRTKNRMGALGAGVFGGSFAGTLLFVGIKRRRFKI